MCDRNPFVRILSTSSTINTESLGIFFGQFEKDDKKIMRII